MVSEDLLGANLVMVHEEMCQFYTNRKRDADTIKWHGPFSHDEAKDTAESISQNHKKGWRSRQVCMAKTR
jgi:hypothetical protein